MNTVDLFLLIAIMVTFTGALCLYSISVYPESVKFC